MSKKPYIVFWSKAYYASGETVVLAESPDDANDEVYDKMGDYEGSIQYYPDEDVVDVQEMDEKDYEQYKKCNNIT
jgi:hypothetical protein